MSELKPGPAGEAPRSSPVEVADRLLKDRPQFSIRLQIYLSVLLLFVTAIIIGVTTISITTSVQQDARRFEVASRLLFEIEQARRFEKNYFLHGTNLGDAVENVHRARQLLRRTGEPLRQEQDARLLARLTRHLDRYTELLELKLDHKGDGAARGEETLRRHGRELVGLAADLEAATRRSLDSELMISRVVQFGLLAFLLLYILLMTYVLVRRIAAPIRRLMEHTRRIAGGDHTPITPARRYRDEFSALAVSINDMLAELERRQDVLVASHKLRAIGTLTAGVAHELNNPINNITLTAHVMLEEGEELDAAERQEMMQDIVGEADRAKHIVAGLLDFARQTERHVEPIELAAVVEDTLALAQNQLNLKGARAKLQAAPHLPMVHGDAQQLSQVVLNLLLNAVDVTERGGTIDVRVAAGGEGYVRVEVQDHGPGIPEHVLPFIFDPFFTTKAKNKGTGLGLAICRGIVKKHGGDLSVKTRAGEGTTFVMELPVTTIPADFGAVAEQRGRADAGG